MDSSGEAKKAVIRHWAASVKAQAPPPAKPSPNWRRAETVWAAYSGDVDSTPPLERWCLFSFSARHEMAYRLENSEPAGNSEPKVDPMLSAAPPRPLPMAPVMSLRPPPMAPVMSLRPPPMAPVTI